MEETISQPFFSQLASDKALKPLSSLSFSPISLLVQSWVTNRASEKRKKEEKRPVNWNWPYSEINGSFSSSISLLAWVFPTFWSHGKEKIVHWTKRSCFSHNQWCLSFLKGDEMDTDSLDIDTFSSYLFPCRGMDSLGGEASEIKCWLAGSRPYARLIDLMIWETQGHFFLYFYLILVIRT